jgi:hypothetical protein
MSEIQQAGLVDKKILDNLTRYIEKFLYILYSIFMLGNFFAIPEIKYIYALICIFLIIHILKRGWLESVHMVIGFCFIEGQGRILWEYTPIVRIIFDITVILALFGKIIRDKTLFPRKWLSNFMATLFVLHFFIYVVELFNTNSVGLIGVLAASKIYIVPLLFFFMFLEKPLIDVKYLKRAQNVTIFFFITQTILAYIQMTYGETFMLALNPYYAKPLRGDQFTGWLFRPFGTSYVPGAYALFYPFTLGFLYVVNRGLRFSIFRNLLVAIGFFGIFTSQVRSVLVKYILIFALINFALLFIQRNRFKSMVVNMLSIGLIVFASLFVDFDSSNLNLESAIMRFNSIGNVEQVSSSRIGFSQFIEVMSDKLSDNVLGLGPGRTGAANNISLGFIENDPLYGKYSSWASDNLFISLAIDFGWGMIFYILIILLFPLRLVSFTIFKFKSMSHERFRLVAISSAVSLVILIGNWGAIGLPYNPESFFFWLWVSIGWRSYFRDESLV